MLSILGGIVVVASCTEGGSPDVTPDAAGTADAAPAADGRIIDAMIDAPACPQLWQRSFPQDGVTESLSLGAGVVNHAFSVDSSVGTSYTGTSLSSSFNFLPTAATTFRLDLKDFTATNNAIISAGTNDHSVTLARSDGQTIVYFSAPASHSFPQSSGAITLKYSGGVANTMGTLTLSFEPLNGTRAAVRTLPYLITAVPSNISISASAGANGSVSVGYDTATLQTEGSTIVDDFNCISIGD